MLKRLAGRPVPTVTVSIAGIAAVALAVFFIAIQISPSKGESESSVVAWVVGVPFLLLWWLWLASPYFGITFAAILFARRTASSIVILIGTILILGLGAWMLADVMLSSSNGQGAIAIFLLPVYQWVGLLLVVGLAAAVAPFARAT